MSRRAVLVRAAERVAQVINAARGDLAGENSFEAVRSYADWQHPLEDDRLQVDVVPGGIISVQLETRSEITYRVAVDIGVRQRLGQLYQEDDSGRVATARIDQLVLLAEQLHELLIVNRLDDLVGEGQNEYRASYDAEQLRQMRQFVSVVRVAFDLTKDIGAA